MNEHPNVTVLKKLTGAQIMEFTRDQIVSYLGLDMALTPDQRAKCQLPLGFLKSQLDLLNLQRQRQQRLDKLLSPTTKKLSPSTKQLSPTNKQLSPTNKQLSPTNKQISPTNKQLSPTNKQLSEATKQLSEASKTKKTVGNVISLKKAELTHQQAHCSSRFQSVQSQVASFMFKQKSKLPQQKTQCELWRLLKQKSQYFLSVGKQVDINICPTKNTEKEKLE